MKKRERGKRKRGARRGRGSRQESYDVWMLTSHPAQRSITPQPAFLARLSADVGLPGSAALVAHKPSKIPQPSAGTAEMPKVPHSRLFIEPTTPWTAPATRPRPHHSSQGKSSEERRNEKMQKGRREQQPQQQQQQNGFTFFS